MAVGEPGDVPYGALRNAEAILVCQKHLGVSQHGEQGKTRSVRNAGHF